MTLLSPEAVAQMVAELRAEANGMRLSVNDEYDGKTFHYANWLDKPRRVVLDGCRHMENSADMLTTLAAENATLRADNENLLNNTQIHISDDVARAALGEAMQTVATLRASEAAALERVKVLTDAVKEGRRAIGDHFAPHDCYATGPMTGDTFRDLVQCPACSFIAMYDAAVAAPQLASDIRVSGELSALLRNWCVWGGSISARHAKEIRALIAPSSTALTLTADKEPKT